MGVPQNQFGMGGGGMAFGNPQAGLNQAQAPRPQHFGTYLPGSAAHVAAFHAKGPENEIKFFVGGLAFLTQGMYLCLITYFS